MIICDVCKTKSSERFNLPPEVRTEKVTDLCTECGKTYSDHMQVFVQPLNQQIITEARRFLISKSQDFYVKEQEKGAHNATD